jgi:hypothetical protein
MSPPPSTGMQIYEYLHGPGGAGAPGAPPQAYIAKGVRANTMVSPLRASGPPSDASKWIIGNLVLHTILMEVFILN